MGVSFGEMRINPVPKSAPIHGALGISSIVGCSRAREVIGAIALREDVLQKQRIAPVEADSSAH